MILILDEYNDLVINTDIETGGGTVSDEPKRSDRFRLNKNSKVNGKQLPLIETESTKWYKRWWVWLIFALLGLVLLGGLWMWTYANTFEKLTSTEVEVLYEDVKKGWDTNIFEEKSAVNILVFGLDENSLQNGSTLTDTIMLVSIKPNATVHLLSIPRDLWIDSLKTKVNALYYYGEQSDDTTGEELLGSVIENISGVEIENYFKMDMTKLKQIIDGVGGIEVNVEHAFVDDQFPREGVDKSSTDSSVLYETVKFEAGRQMFDGDRALKYIRSRQSNDREEGTDTARTVRQQQVVMALMQRLMSDKKMWLDPKTSGQLYAIWADIDTDLDNVKLVSVGKSFVGQELDVITHTFPEVDKAGNGLIYNPPIGKRDQWVFEPLDPSFLEMNDWVKQELE